MDNETFFKEKVIPLLVNWMNNDIRFYMFADVGQIDFKYAEKGFESRENAAQCSYEKRRITFNIDWLKDRFKYNEIYQIEYLIMHEVRHFYQRRVVESYTNKEGIRLYESPSIIRAWKDNFEHYIRNKGGEGEDDKDYFTQPVEVDAVAYSYYLLLHLHPEINPRALYVNRYVEPIIKKLYCQYRQFLIIADQNKAFFL